MVSKKILSLSKLVDILTSKFYTLVSIYYDLKAESIVFLEVRTPKVQKTFFVAIPPKYTMKMDVSNYKKIEISPRSNSLAEKQLEYISEIKGVLVDSDIMAISSSIMCLQKNNGNVVCYGFGAMTVEKEEVSEDEVVNTEVDTVSRILDDAKKIKDFVDPVIEIEEEPEEEPEEEIEEDKDGSEKDGKDDGHDNENEVEERKQSDLQEEENVAGVELEFDITPSTKSIVETDLKEISKKIVVPDVQKKKPRVLKNVEEQIEQEIIILPQPKPESLKQRNDNSVPLDIQDSDLSLGIIYYSLDLDSFYKKINPKVVPMSSTKSVSLQPASANLELEAEILGVYDAIDDNEGDMRLSKLDEITELALKVVQKSKDSLELFKKEEMNLKSQILKLSTVLDQTDALKVRISKTPDKFTDTKPEIDRLRNQTKTTIHEINIELLKNRDLVEDMLTTTKISLEELLDM